MRVRHASRTAGISSPWNHGSLTQVQPLVEPGEWGNAPTVKWQWQITKAADPWSHKIICHISVLWEAASCWEALPKTASSVALFQTTEIGLMKSRSFYQRLLCPGKPSLLLESEKPCVSQEIPYLQVATFWSAQSMKRQSLSSVGFLSDTCSGFFDLLSLNGGGRVMLHEKYIQNPRFAFETIGPKACFLAI